MRSPGYASALIIVSIVAAVTVAVAMGSNVPSWYVAIMSSILGVAGVSHGVSVLTSSSNSTMAQAGTVEAQHVAATAQLQTAPVSGSTTAVPTVAGAIQ